jgi:hypothetical protein
MVPATPVAASRRRETEFRPSVRSQVAEVVPVWWTWGEEVGNDATMNDEKQTKRQKRFYDEAFRREAVALMEGSGETLAQIAAKLGVSHWNLRDWRKRYGAAGVRPRRFVWGRSSLVLRLSSIEMTFSSLTTSFCSLGSSLKCDIGQW